MDGGGGAGGGGAVGQYNPRTVEEVFRDFKGRRTGMIKALTQDVKEFYRQCDPGSSNSQLVMFVFSVFGYVYSFCYGKTNCGLEDLRDYRVLIHWPSFEDVVILCVEQADFVIVVSRGDYLFLRDVTQSVVEICYKLFRFFWEKENLCLYGFPSEQWEVNLPAEEVPPELPEPALGINFARDGMQEKDWLALVAVHSDAWLLAVAFYFGARFGFDKNERKRLFTMMNDLPTIFEVVTGNAKKHVKEKSSVSNHSSNKPKSNSKMAWDVLAVAAQDNCVDIPYQCPRRPSEPQPTKYAKPTPPPRDDEEGLEDDEEDEHGDALCGACGENYAADEFWICCDICEKWFHGKCVKITPARAEHIKQYKCPSCSNKRSRP
ncbi:hypothetical protein C5167_031411 [Papaver somniferum]|uniref:PHD finger protein ALFIN-LIKE n=1 Tax=Papaver somniferum TaxID=3469 RepID=A0A4Y7K478_PAPSO|nr:hypothetical protein C5167_031411 [Papaver somniferum]